MDSRMQLLLTSDGRPIVQHPTVDEVILILMAFGGYPIRKPAPAAVVAAHRPEHPLLGLDVPPVTPAVPAAKAPPVVASPPPVPASAPSPVAAPATEAPHGTGKHPAGLEEVGRLVQFLVGPGTRHHREVQREVVAKRIGVSARTIKHYEDGTRAPSPRSMEALHAYAADHHGIGFCRDFDWGTIKAAVRARAHNLPRTWRQTTNKQEGA